MNRPIDWRRIRIALEMTQKEFAAELDTSEPTIKRLESPGGWPQVSQRVVTNLQLLLTNGYVRALLKENHAPNPFPDVTPAWVLYRRLGPRCQVDGIPFRGHARCAACTELAGPGHSVRLDIHGLCDSCVREIEEGRMTVLLPNGKPRYPERDQVETR